MNKHYYLVSGTVLFTVPDQEMLMNVPLNATIQMNKKLPITVQDLGRAQVALQHNLMNQIGPEEFLKINVQNVVMNGFVYLGLMSEEEFNKPPEGTQLAEMNPTVVPLV